MPILQTRMIALIAAGKDYQQALRRLVNVIEREEHDAQEAMEDDNLEHRSEKLSNAIQNILTGAQELFLLKSPLDSGRVLDLEEAHFNRSKKRNIKSREWLQDARADGRYRTGESKGTTRAQTADKTTKHSRPDLDAEVDAEHKRTHQEVESDGVNLIAAEDGQTTD